jgi:transcriptional regulator with XRE-family HTH domain
MPDLQQVKRGGVELEFGKKIRRLREDQQMTVRQLAQLVECTPSFISQIERDMANPTINTLKKISMVLGVSLVDFFEEEIHSNEIEKNFIVRKNKRKKFNSESESTVIQLLSPSVMESKNIEMHLMAIEPGGTSDKLYTNIAEEVGYVLKGKITIILGNDRFDLGEGDSIYFSGKIPHGWENESNSEAVMLFAATPSVIRTGESLLLGGTNYVAQP